MSSEANLSDREEGRVGPARWKPAEISLPNDWTTEKLKRLAIVRPSGVDKKSSEEEAVIHLCNYTDVYYEDRITDAPEFMQATASEREIDRFELRAGDILLTKDSESWDDIGVPALVAQDLPRVLCGYHLFLLRPDKNQVEPGYLFWATKSRFVAFQIEGAATGVTRFGLATRDVGDAWSPLPPSGTQAQIAAFLDHHTARIDQLIEKKQRLLDLLEEKRQAVITRAVTKGLDPDVEMKDSGVKWIGEIPRSWTLTALRWVADSLTVGIVVNPTEHLSQEGVPYLRGVNVFRYRVSLKDVHRMTEEDSIRFSKSRLEAGDVVSMRVGDPGVSAVIGEGLSGSNCASLMVTKNRGRFDPWWLCAFYNSKAGMFQFRLLQAGAAQEQINISDAGDMQVPVPPPGQQERIGAHVREVLRQTSALDIRIRDAVELLQEKRQALITAAVTGQIDVTDWQPPDQEAAPA